MSSINYTIIVGADYVHPLNDAFVYSNTPRIRDAILCAEAACACYPTSPVYIRWERLHGGQVGYLNRHTGHELFGNDWNIFKQLMLNEEVHSV